MASRPRACCISMRRRISAFSPPSAPPSPPSPARRSSKRRARRAAPGSASWRRARARAPSAGGASARGSPPQAARRRRLLLQGNRRFSARAPISGVSSFALSRGCAAPSFAPGVSPRAQALAVVDARVVESLLRGVAGQRVHEGRGVDGQRRTRTTGRGSKRFAFRHRFRLRRQGEKETPAILSFPFRLSVSRFAKVGIPKGTCRSERFGRKGSGRR